MKRNRDDQQRKPEPRVPGPIKRPKSNQACASCRRHKTRCEQLEGDLSILRCHRCNVLNMSCSFETLFTPNDISSSSTEPPVPPPSTDQPTRYSDFGPVKSQQLEDVPSLEGVPVFPSPRMSFQDLMQRVNMSWGPNRVVDVPGGFDWTGNPMLALQELVRRQPEDDSVPVPSVLNVLTREQTKCLLDEFDSRYGPWVNLPPTQDGHTPFLDLARCSVASRHLDVATRSILQPRLKDAARKAIMRQMFSSMPTTDAIHAILVYSLWPQDDAIDTRLLLGSAVSMAMNVRLGLASESAISLQKMQKRDQGLSKENLRQLAEATEQARLWISLTNAESMLCLGTGRTPLSRRSSADKNVLETYSLSAVTHGRDMRLGLMSQLFDLTERGTLIRLASFSDLDKWHKEVLDVLVKMDSLHRIITPLPVVAEHDVFYFHMLLVYYYSCRLLILHQALREARRVLASQCSDTPWYRHFVHNGVNIAAAWGHEALMSAESVLVTLISRSEPMLIGTAPDILFTFVSFAASFLIMAKFAVFEYHGARLGGSGDALLAKTIERLSEVAYAPEHCAARCARLIASSLAAWGKRIAKADDEGTLTEHDPVTSMQAIVPELASDPVPPMTDLFNADASHDFNRFMNSDIFLDTDFWASFMNNLSSTPTPQSV